MRGKSGGPGRDSPTAPSTRSATVTMTVNTGRLMAIAEMFMSAGTEVVAFADLGARVEDDGVRRGHAGAHEEGAALALGEGDADEVRLAKGEHDHLVLRTGPERA